MRIASLVPSITELLFDLGLTSAEVVGRTKFCIHPADAVRNVARVGGTKNVAIERVLALHPTLVLANREENVREQVEALERYVPVHVTNVATLPDALAMIRDVGALVNRADAADALAERIATSLANLEKPAVQRSVAYFIWRGPWMVAGGDTFISAMLNAAGFQNAFADRLRYPVVTLQEVAAARPDYVFLSSEPYPFREKHVNELAAALPGVRPVTVDGELFSWYGSRLLRAADYFRQLHQRLNREDV